MGRVGYRVALGRGAEISRLHPPPPGREFRTKGKRPVFGAGNLDEHTGSPLFENSVYQVAMKKVLEPLF